MKHDLVGIPERRREEVVAGFGGAQIVKLLNGKLEIRGGSEKEKAQAHFWMKQFLARGSLALRRIG
jgi:hypothetical protein